MVTSAQRDVAEFTYSVRTSCTYSVYVHRITSWLGKYAGCTHAMYVQCAYGDVMIQCLLSVINTDFSARNGVVHLPFFGKNIKYE